jgi:Ion channel
VTCLYFSMVTWTTLGYGDVRPSDNARMLAASEAVLGYMFLGLWVWILSVLFRQIFGPSMRPDMIRGQWLGDVPGVPLW